MGPPSRLAVAGLGALGIIAFLLILGLTAGGNGGKNGSSSQARKDATRAHRAGRRKAVAAPAPHAPPGKVKLAVVASRPVWVCLVDARNNPRVNGVILTAGNRVGPFTSRSFKVTVGNGGGDLVVNGKRRKTPELSQPLSFAVSGTRTSRLPVTQAPACR